MSGTGKPRSKRKSMQPRRVIYNSATSPDDGEEHRREVKYISAQKDDGERQQDMQQVECDAVRPDQSASSSEGGANSDEAVVSGARSVRVEKDASARDDLDDSASGERLMRNPAGVDAGCSNIFKSQADLMNDKNLSNGGPFVCDICEKRFSQKRYLNAHQRVHSNYRPHACDLCEKRFKQKEHLIVHQRVHSNYRPYACDLCEKRFTQKYHLKAHQRVHSNYRPHACDLCEKKFKTKIELIRHEKRHKHDRPHACNVCKKKFKTKIDLRSHQKRHVDNRHKPTTLENSGLRRRLF